MITLAWHTTSYSLLNVYWFETILLHTCTNTAVVNINGLQDTHADVTQEWMTIFSIDVIMCSNMYKALKCNVINRAEITYHIFYHILVG